MANALLRSCVSEDFVMATQGPGEEEAQEDQQRVPRSAHAGLPGQAVNCSEFGPVSTSPVSRAVCATSSAMEMYVRFWDLRSTPPSRCGQSSASASSDAWDGHLLRAVKADSGVSAFAVSSGSGELLALATLCGEVQVRQAETETRSPVRASSY